LQWGLSQALSTFKEGGYLPPFFLHQQNKTQDGFSAQKTFSSLTIACYSVPKN
jgi:hypothetical protein